MKIIKPNAILLEGEPYQKIERCGRICYKSENNITTESAINFVNRMIQNGHLAMLEHSTIYLKIYSKNFVNALIAMLETLKNSKNDNITPYINITTDFSVCYISASFRTFLNLLNAEITDYKDIQTAIAVGLNTKFPEVFKIDNEYRLSTKMDIFNENEFIDDVIAEYGFFADDILKKHITHSIVFTCDRGVSHEFVRHRPCSFAQESTRYCSYNKAKFGSEITVIEPLFFKDSIDKYAMWKTGCEVAEKMYFSLIDNGATPQEARSVLPNSLKTELVITATENEWQHIVNLRLLGTTGKPHPQMVECMKIAYPILHEVSNGRISGYNNVSE